MHEFYIKIIVEGDEEQTFFEIVKQIGTDPIFYLEIENAEGCGNIHSVLLDAIRAEIYDCVLCVYDVDNKIGDDTSSFSITRKKITSIFGSEVVTDSISFCTNPNILQYFLLAADKLENVALTNTSKSANSEIIHKYWPQIGTDNKIKTKYKAKDWQLKIIKYSILNEEYKYSNLLINALELDTNYKTNVPAGNLLPLLNALKNGDKNFFYNIQKIIDSIDD